MGNNTTSTPIETPTGTPLEPVFGQPYRPRLVDGPRWLAEIMYSPDPWMVDAVYAAQWLVVGLALLGYYRYGFDKQTARQMLYNAFVVFGVWGATNALHLGPELPYWLHVILGFALGVGLGHATFHGLDWLFQPGGPDAADAGEEAAD